MRFCPECGSPIEAGMRFCTGCGHPLQAEPAEQPAAPTGFYAPGDLNEAQSDIPAPQPEPAPTVFYTQDNGNPVQPVSAPKKKGKTALIVAIAAGATLLLAVVVLAVWFLNPVSRVVRSIENGDYQQARSIYQQSVTQNGNRDHKAREKVEAYGQELMEQFTEQEITYDYLMNKLQGIEEIGVLGSDVDRMMEDAEYLHNCREIFAEAEEAMEQGDYRNALMCYAIVADADFENGEVAADRYGEAVEAFRTQVVAEARDYVNGGEFGMAMTLLQDALGLVPGDPELTQAQQDCIQAEYDNDIQLLLEEARVYAQAKDYISALSFLDSCIATYPDEQALQQEKSSCLSAYETYVTEESLRLAGEGKYQNALSLAQAGLNYFDSAYVTELAIIYKSYIPVILGEMEMFQNNTEGGSWVTETDEVDKYLEDNYGNTYANSFTVGCGSVTYLVNFQYQTFSGTVAFPKGLESSSARSSATLTVYGDGVKIAEFVGVNDASRPEEFSVDISGYERLTLEWECDGYNVWEDWGDFATIFDGLLLPVPMELP